MSATITAPHPAVGENAARPNALALIIGGSDLAHELTRETNELFTISGPVRVVGPCSLRHRIVRRPIELLNCRFEGPVDLRYAELYQSVNFSGCKFYDAFNSGDEIESCTIFHKDLNCAGVQFFQQVSFNGARVDGSAYFHHARFHRLAQPREHYSADFTAFACRGSLEFNHAIFCGSVSFNAMRCGDALFEDVAFQDSQHPVNFRNACCEGNLQIWTDAARRGAGGEPEAGQTAADADDRGPVFHGGADFASIRCGRKTILSGCEFRGPQKVNFKCASFGLLLECNDACFAGPVSFVGTRAQDYMDFSRTRFTHCAPPASAAGPRQPGDNDDDVDLRFIRTGGNLSLKGALVRGSINLGQAAVGGKLRLGGAQFFNDVKLYDASMKILELCSKRDEGEAGQTLSIEEMLPFKKPESLNVASCSFERFHGGRPEIEQRLALAFVRRQDPRKFSRDPYLQLEQYYRRNGQEHAADIIHLEGHKAIHLNARRAESRCVSWSFSQLCRDWLFWKLTGWGQQPIRILYLSLWIVLAGAAIFSPPDALRPTRAYVEYLSGAGVALPQGREVVAADIVELSTLGDGFRHLIERFCYSLDLFLPAIDLGYTARWEPPIASVYATLASVEFTLGWMLVPLLLAAFTGIIKRD